MRQDFNIVAELVLYKKSKPDKSSSPRFQVLKRHVKISNVRDTNLKRYLIDLGLGMYIENTFLIDKIFQVLYHTINIQETTV